MAFFYNMTGFIFQIFPQWPYGHIIWSDDLVATDNAYVSATLRKCSGTPDGSGPAQNIRPSGAASWR
jgi:hypothetical protein